MTKISVVIHTCNNAKIIRECLESVKEFDEIVVCDMYSDDETLEIAREYNCKIVMHEKTGFVEPARNFGISNASNEWVLVVDSDEKITPELRNYLYEFIKEPGKVSSIRIPRLNYAWGKPLEILYPDYIVRFFKKDAIFWPPQVHATPEIIYGERIDIDKNRKELAILHKYTSSMKQVIKTLNKYTDLEYEKALNRKDKTNFTFAVWKSLWLIIEKLILKGGFKDGKRGFIIAICAGFYKFTSYVKLYEQNGVLDNEKN